MSPPPDAGQWLYARFVKFLDPGGEDGDDPLLRGLGATLPHARKAGSKMRIGPGSGVLITESRVTVATDVVPNHAPTSDIVWHGLDKTSSYRIATDVILNPPSSPYLFVAFGKSYAGIRASLRIGISRDVVQLSGNGAMTVLRRPVIDAYESLEHVPLATYCSLTTLVLQRLRDPDNKRIATTIAQITDKLGDKGRIALDVAETGPQCNTPEYAALARLLTARAKAKKISASVEN